MTLLRVGTNFDGSRMDVRLGYDTSPIRITGHNALGLYTALVAACPSGLLSDNMDGTVVADQIENIVADRIEAVGDSGVDTFAEYQRCRAELWPELPHLTDLIVAVARPSDDDAAAQIIRALQRGRTVGVYAITTGFDADDAFLTTIDTGHTTATVTHLWGDRDFLLS